MRDWLVVVGFSHIYKYSTSQSFVKIEFQYLDLYSTLYIPERANTEYPWRIAVSVLKQSEIVIPGRDTTMSTDWRRFDNDATNNWSYTFEKDSDFTRQRMNKNLERSVQGDNERQF